jgi:hypothetical protein
MTREELKSLLELSDSLEELAHHIKELMCAMKIADACAQIERKTSMNQK